MDPVDARTKDKKKPGVLPKKPDTHRQAPLKPGSKSCCGRLAGPNLSVSARHGHFEVSSGVFMVFRNGLLLRTMHVRGETLVLMDMHARSLVRPTYTCLILPDFFHLSRFFFDFFVACDFF